MFRGLKNAVKGGIGVVSEKGSDLAGSVVGDPDLGTSSLKTKLKEGAKTTFKGGSQFVEQGTENFTETVGSERVEVNLTVRSPLGVNVEPATQVIDLNRQAVFTCSVVGWPVESTSWYKNGYPLHVSHR